MEKGNYVLRIEFNNMKNIGKHRIYNGVLSYRYTNRFFMFLDTEMLHCYNLTSIKDIKIYDEKKRRK